jgi:cytochrome c oxidase subunit 2
MLLAKSHLTKRLKMPILGNKGDEIQAADVQALLPKKAAAKTEEKSEKVAEKEENHADMALADLVAQGKSVYEKSCSSCHSPEGTGLPGTFPALKASPVVIGDINKQVELMLNGKGMMPGFGSLLSAADFAAVVTYTRNELGNSVGDMLQPAAVKSLQSAKK